MTDQGNQPAQVRLDGATAKPAGEGRKQPSVGKQLAVVLIAGLAIWVTVQVFRGGGALSNAQIEACKFDFGQAFFNWYGGSFDDYDFSKAQLTGAYKVNKSADNFTNYMYEIPNNKGARPLTCGIYERGGKWLSVTKNPW